jgi:hypothetical protein
MAGPAILSYHPSVTANKSLKDRLQASPVGLQVRRSTNKQLLRWYLHTRPWVHVHC